MIKRLLKYLLILSFIIFIVPVYAQDETEPFDDSIFLPKEYKTEEVEEKEEIDSNVEPENGVISESKCVIEDDADLLTEEEERRLFDQMMPLTEFGVIAFKTINENNSTTPDYASDFYHSTFGTQSGTLFIIDMDNRQLYIFSDGSNYNIITSNKAYSITDNVYRYATNEEYFECASKTFEQINALLNGYKIAEPMRYISNGFIAIILAAFINFFIIMSKSKLKKSSDSEMLKGCKVKFDVTDIKGHQIGTRRVYSPPSDSGGSGFGSSGGGFSGGGGGGGSSGGGGGHGF